MYLLFFSLMFQNFGYLCFIVSQKRALILLLQLELCKLDRKYDITHIPGPGEQRFIMQNLIKLHT